MYTQPFNYPSHLMRSELEGVDGVHVHASKLLAVHRKGGVIPLNHLEPIAFHMKLVAEVTRVLVVAVHALRAGQAVVSAQNLLLAGTAPGHTGLDAAEFHSIMAQHHHHDWCVHAYVQVTKNICHGGDTKSM